MAIADTIQRIRDEIGPNIKLVVVTKNHSVREIEEVLTTGAVDIGENRIQEAREKFPKIIALNTQNVSNLGLVGPEFETPHGRARERDASPSRITRHLIGHLQTNKAKYAVELFDMIHSVDSVHLAEALEKEAAKINRTIPILLQVNIANDPNKHGLQPKETAAALEQIRATCPHLPVKGLMTIVPHVDDPEKTRPHFRALRQLRDELGLQELSMGMSHDYHIAVEEGATLVRIGSAIFA